MRRLRCFPFSPNYIFTEKTVDTYVTIFYLPRRGDLFPRKFDFILPKFDFILPNYHFALQWMFLLSSVSISNFLREECDAVLFIIPCLDLPLPSSEMNLALSAKLPLPSRLFPIIVATTEREFTDNIIYQFIDKIISLVRI
ncbi:hypothetical protein IX299_000331 [Porphyromonas levii]|nr:hypothetical protein [Porphyromonas levii]